MAGQQGCTRLVDLPLELVAEIHRRLGFVDRLNMAVVLGNRLLCEEAPCLLLPGDTAETAKLFSVAERQGATARAPDPAMRDHVVLGSSGGWVVTADLHGSLRMANPVGGEQAELPDITAGTIPFVGRFVIDLRAFAQIRFGGHQPPAGTFTHADWQMRKWFYRKVLLSASPRPNNYAAMLILDERFGAPAFSTADDPAWRLAPSRDAVEDAIHHNGRFFSITHSGVVAAWDRHAQTGEYTSTEVGPSLPGGEHVRPQHRRKKYIAAAPDGRLMAVLKESKKVKEETGYYYFRNYAAPSFKVLVLDAPGRQWVETRDIGDFALFVGVNNSLCVSSAGTGIRAGCIYYCDDELGKASLRLEQGRHGEPVFRSSIDSGCCDYDLQDIGVFSLKDGTTKRVDGLPRHMCWPPPAWIRPSLR